MSRRGSTSSASRAVGIAAGVGSRWVEIPWRVASAPERHPVPLKEYTAPAGRPTATHPPDPAGEHSRLRGPEISLTRCLRRYSASPSPGLADASHASPTPTTPLPPLLGWGEGGRSIHPPPTQQGPSLKLAVPAGQRASRSAGVRVSATPATAGTYRPSTSTDYERCPSQWTTDTTPPTRPLAYSHPLAPALALR